ncbi:hypothetical protein ACMAY8_14140 [Rhodobacteraceae bacterium nBUS_22]
MLLTFKPLIARFCITKTMALTHISMVENMLVGREIIAIGIAGHKRSG